MALRLFVAFAATLVSAAPALGDAGLVAASLEGQIEGGGPRDRLTVELHSERRALVARANPDPAGRFAFHGLEPGNYDLRVTNLSGALVYQSVVPVRGERARVSVELPPAPSGAAPPGTVSMASLGHKVPPAARKEFRKAEQAFARNRVDEAMARLEKAVAADPLFAEAWVNLGSCYARLERYEEAAGRFGRATALDPDLAPARVNLGHMLLLLNRFGDAERELRHAVRLEPHVARNRYLLGLALRGLRRDEEAIPEFERAAPAVPIAGMFAAELLAANGRKQEAANHLRTYLHSASVPDRAAVQSLLERLER